MGCDFFHNQNESAQAQLMFVNEIVYRNLPAIFKVAFGVAKHQPGRPHRRLGVMGRLRPPKFWSAFLVIVGRIWLGLM